MLSLAAWLYFVSGPRAARPGMEAIDLHAYFYPRYVWGAERLASGHLPLWNPYELFGLPFLAAAQPGVFYLPKQLLFWLLPSPLAIAAVPIIHRWLAAVFFLLYARRVLGVGPAAASTGAVLWAFNPLALVAGWAPLRLEALAWVPLCLHAAARLPEASGHRWAVALGWLLALQLVAGYPDYTGVTVILGALHPLLEYGPRRRRALVRFGSAVVLAALLAGPQLLPLVSLVVASARAEVMQRASWAITELSLTGTFRALDPAHVALALAGLALAPAPRRRFPTVAAAVVAAAILLYPLLRQVLLFRLTRTLAFICYEVAYIPLAALAALAVDHLLSGPRTEPRNRWLLGGLAGLVAAEVAAAPYHLASAVAAVVALALCGLAPLRPRSGRAAATALPLVIFAGLLAEAPRAGALYAPRPADRRAALAPIARRLGRAPGQLRFVAPEHTRYGDQLFAGVRSAATHEESLLPRRQQRIFDHLGLYSLVLWGRPVPWRRYVSSHPLVDEAGIALVEAPEEARRVLAVPGGFEPIARTGPGWLLFRNPTVLPRARFVSRARYVNSEAAAFAAVIRSDFRPRDKVVLERRPGDSPPPGSPPAHASPGRARVRIVRDEPEEVVIEARLPAPGFLVLADAYDPGWRATANGQPVEVRPADAVFRAVHLGAGKWHIRFRYRPWDVRAGLWLALGGVVTSLAVLLATRRRGRARVA